MLDYYTIFPIEFDVLDAAIMSFLRNTSYPNVTRERISTALTTYTLHDSLGNFARVEMRKIDKEHSTLECTMLPEQDNFLYEARQMQLDMFSDKLVHAIASVYPPPPGAASDALTSPNNSTGDGQGKGASAEAKRKLEYRAELRQNLTERFNRDELRTLCFDLGIEHENLPEAKDSMARELVACCEQTGSISALVAKCKELRPDVSWDDMPDAARKVW